MLRFSLVSLERTYSLINFAGFQNGSSKNQLSLRRNEDKVTLMRGILCRSLLALCVSLLEHCRILPQGMVMFPEREMLSIQILKDKPLSRLGPFVARAVDGSLGIRPELLQNTQ